ncbi:hypothetical protein, partial [Candidatus Skiveiella danica]|uniref:hypothetical protein n=1 Tax=Candidatus Skiveiella danica TaxID=3386177 RepID=UPI0039B9577F
RGVSALGGCWIGVCAPVRLTVAIHGRDGLRCRIQLMAASTSMLVRGFPARAGRSTERPRPAGL